MGFVGPHLARWRLGFSQLVSLEPPARSCRLGESLSEDDMAAAGIMGLKPPNFFCKCSKRGAATPGFE